MSEYIDGQPMDQWLRTNRLTQRESAELCVVIAKAVEHAHQRQVIHCDLKPSNILIDRAGLPHITDFGLAKRAASDITMTTEGRLLGTPAYMSPEQASGQAGQADRRSDVYSLGVILFELLTGELPFRGQVHTLLRRVVEDEPPSPRQLNATVSRDMETICLKCLEKDPTRRYASARELADDLVTVLQLLLKLIDFLVLRILLPFHVGRIKTPCKGALSVLKKLFLPVVILRGMDLKFVTQIGHRHVLDQMTANHRHLLAG